MKGRQIVYSPMEMTWLEENRRLVIGEYHLQFCFQFGRNVSAQNLHALRKRKGWKTGRTGHFKQGLDPHNKGRKFAPGTGGLHPNARKTQYGAGNRSGRAAEKYKPIGTERLSQDGYRERKVHDGLPMQSRWQSVHRIEWELAHGLLPKGMALKCKGDRLNTDPSNWEVVSRSILPRLNGGRRKQHIAYDDAPDELKPAIMAVAKLDDLARKIRRGSAKASRPLKNGTAITRPDKRIGARIEERT